uniref:COX assembly mitochondrial protein n=2 Tax=Rhodnius prolixus TaxID=13249 RepID=T1IBG1_RHOPR
MVGQQELNSTLKEKSQGPLGLGDPDDKRLRRVEIDVMIPKKMREKARKEKCNLEVEDFNQCCLKNGVSMVYKCRTENEKMRSCLTKWYYDEDFKNECRHEYLEERSFYRKTGIGVKQKLKM